MPNPANVNPVNTPTAYSPTSAFSCALKAMIRRIATTASTKIPLENARRWPRLVSWRGRNESPATKLARYGKPLKLVLPPVNRMSTVAACTT